MTHPAETRHWAITEEWLRLLLDTDPQASFDGEDRPGGGMRVENGVAIIPVCGPLARREDFISWLFGDATYEGIAAQFSQAIADDGVRAIVLDVDSPGGEVAGCSELSDLIFAARGRKPITAYVGGYGASAAYWLASAADRIVCSATALLGSIGVRTALVDQSKRDAAAGIKRIEIVSSQSPFKVTDPSKQEDLDRVQAQVDALAAVFVDSVARNRGVTPKAVVERYGRGDCLVGKAAVEAGLADAIGTIGDAIQGAAVRRPETFAAAKAAAQETNMKCKKCENEHDDGYCEGCYSEAAKAAAPPAPPEDDEGEEPEDEAKGLAAELVQLTGKASAAEIVGVVTAWRDAGTKAAALAAELAALKTAQAERDFDALVEQGRKDGKIAPVQAQSAWLKGLRSSEGGLAQLKAYLEAAPVLLHAEAGVPASANGAPQPPVLTPLDRRIAAQMGTNLTTLAAERAKGLGVTK